MGAWDHLESFKKVKKEEEICELDKIREDFEKENGDKFLSMTRYCNPSASLKMGEENTIVDVLYFPKYFLNLWSDGTVTWGSSDLERED